MGTHQAITGLAFRGCDHSTDDPAAGNRAGVFSLPERLELDGAGLAPGYRALGACRLTPPVAQRGWSGGLCESYHASLGDRAMANQLDYDRGWYFDHVDTVQS